MSREEAEKDGLVDGHVVLLHVLEDGGGLSYVTCLAVQGNAVLERHSVRGDVLLLKQSHEIWYVNIVPILLINLNR